MIGIILAAGKGSRLVPLTDDRPKTMLEVADGRSILELAIANLAENGVRRIVVVTGHEAVVVERAAGALAARYEVELDLRFNPRFAELNNAYSLWFVRDVFASGCLLVNGDTVHPPSVEATLLDAPADAQVTLALDTRKRLAEEEMKVTTDDRGHAVRLSKLLDPGDAAGEYIGVARIHPEGAAELAEALQVTFERNGDGYYEDGFEELARRGGTVATRPIGDVAWVEVDDHEDLARARAMAGA